MSEMTATRIARAATITVLVLLWCAAARWLWQTEVPRDLRLPHVSADAFLSNAALERRERHARVLRIVGALGLAGQLGVLAALAQRPPRLPGRPAARAAQLGALVGGALVAAALPFELVALWWQRRYGIALVGYGPWLFEHIRPLVTFTLTGAVVAAAALEPARRLGKRWWIAGAPLVILVGALVVLAQPLLTPRLTKLERPALAAEVARLAEREGLDRPRIEVRRAAKRTRAINAEALGVGPTTRLVFWDTALRLPDPELRVLAAHELAHVARRHLWKGLAWFALLALPAVYVIARLVRLDTPEAIPRVALAGALAVLVATPFANAISRRYEAEADWVALRTTRDPGAVRGLLLDISAASLTDPDPPFWSRQLFGTHPSLEERIALTRAFGSRASSARAAAPRADS